jgi:hypothetical protein
VISRKTLFLLFDDIDKEVDEKIRMMRQKYEHPDDPEYREWRDCIERERKNRKRQLVECVS